MDFALPAYHWVKLKESEKKYKYLNLGRELTKLWNLKVIMIPNVIGVRCKGTKGLIKRLKELEMSGLMEIIQTTVLLRSARTLRRIQESWRN